MKCIRVLYFEIDQDKRRQNMELSLKILPENFNGLFSLTQTNTLDHAESVGDPH